MQTCPICKRYYLTSSRFHLCPPKWLCRFDWDKAGDEGAIYADDAEEAAEILVERYDAEYTGLSSDSVIFVYREVTGEGVAIRVEGELVRSYRSRELHAIEDYVEEMVNV